MLLPHSLKNLFPIVLSVYEDLPSFGTECQKYKAKFQIPVIKADELEYKESRNGDWALYGTMKKETGKPHGIMRMIWRGMVFEYQYMDGLMHGLTRYIYKDGTYKLGQHEIGLPTGDWFKYTREGTVMEQKTVEFGKV